jgi:hypothetical protein
MSDRPFYAPNRQTMPRQPIAGGHLWAIGKDGRQLACELRDDGAAGRGSAGLRERELLYGRRFATRALALDKADEWKAQYLRDGGVLIA